MRIVPWTVPAFVASALAVSSPAHAANPSSAECVTANESAIALRTDHLLRQSRERTLVCSAQSCPRAVREVCKKRIGKLEAALAKIVFDVKDASGGNLTDVTVTIDGQPLASHLDGTALFVDPGDHAFSFEAAGLPRVDKHLILQPTDKGRRESITLAPVPPPPPPSAQSDAPPKASPDAPVAHAPAHAGMAPQKIAALAVGAVGVVGIGVGAAFGVLTISSWSNAKNACGPGGTHSCNPTNRSSAVSDHNSAESDSKISTAAFIAGGLLAAGGVTFFFAAGRGSESGAKGVALSPMVGPGLSGFALRGSF